MQYLNILVKCLSILLCFQAEWGVFESVQGWNAQILGKFRGISSPALPQLLKWIVSLNFVLFQGWMDWELLLLNRDILGCLGMEYKWKCSGEFLEGSLQTAMKIHVIAEWERNSCCKTWFLMQVSGRAQLGVGGVGLPCHLLDHGLSNASKPFGLPYGHEKEK